MDLDHIQRAGIYGFVQFGPDPTDHWWSDRLLTSPRRAAFTLRPPW